MTSTSLTELRYALRALYRRPLFALLELSLLTLAAAAVAAIVAVVSATLLRPLPFRDPDALYALPTTEPIAGDSLEEFAAAPIQLARWRAESRTFSSIEGWTPVTLSLSGDGDPSALRGFAISAGLFDLLGTPPAVGRTFRRSEEDSTSGVVILSHAVAQQRFGSDQAAVGKRVTLDGAPKDVIGVMPSGYSMVFQGGDVWVPLDLTLAQQTSRARLRIIASYGRLRPGISLAAARSELEAMQQRLNAEHPEAFKYTGTRIKPLRQNLFGSQSAGMRVLLGALLLIVLVAATNVGNLLVADVVTRRLATMTRLAMGASRSSIVRARLTEAGVLVAVASAVGLALGIAVLKVLASIDPRPFVALNGRWLDWRVAAATLVATLIVGFGPAIPAALTEAGVPIATLAGAAAKGAGARGDRRIRNALAALQVGITVVLLAGASLLARDVMRLLGRSPGFDQQSTFAVIMNLPTRSLPTTPARAQYVQSLVDAVKRVPGIDGASTLQSRFILNETMQTSLELADRPPTTGVADVAQIRHVMPDLFRVLGIRLLRGRGLDSTDRAGTQMTAVVSSSFARQYWPGQDPIGKRLRRAGRSDSEWMTVVGVVDEINDAGAGVPIGPTLYVPYLQQNTPTARVTIVARAHVQPSSLGRAVREAVWKVNAAQAIDDINPLSTLMSRSAAQPRFQAVVVGAFGCSALVLVLAGIYALTLFSVLGRARELAVRAALGASPSSIVSLVVNGSMRPVVVGAVLGTIAAIPVTQIMERSLGASFGTQDVAVVGGVIAVLIAAAVSASLIPARRAAGVSPGAALRG